MAHVRYHYKGWGIVLSSISRKLKAKDVKGASKSNISRIFRGQYDPSYRLLKGIAEVKGMDLEEAGKMLEHCRKQYADFHRRCK